MGDYTVSVVDGSWQVTDTAGTEGTDRLYDIEILDFDDGALTLSQRSYDEVQASAATTDLANPKTVQLADGNVLVTWLNWPSSANVTMSGRIFDTDGDPVSAELDLGALGAYTSNEYYYDVTANPDGGFMVVSTVGGTETYAGGQNIRYAEYDASGAETMSGTANLNTGGATALSSAHVTYLDGGGFVVGWFDLWGGPYQQDYHETYARRFDANGNPQTGDILVNTSTYDTQIQLDVVQLADGNLAFTYASDDDGNNTQGGGQQTDYNVYVKIVDPGFTEDGSHRIAAGSLVQDEFQVNATISGNQKLPWLAPLQGGGFVVAWQDDGGNDGDGVGQFARILQWNGTTSEYEPISPTDIQINEGTGGNQSNLSIAALADGAFVASWTSPHADGSTSRVYARVFEADGTARTGEILIESSGSSAQVDPGVTALADGGFLVAYEGDSGPNAQIYTQRFDADGNQLGGMIITGTADADTIVAGQGDQVLIGGLGNDSLDGGAGEDTAVFAGNSSSYTVTTSDDVTYTVAGADGTDVLTGVETLEFDDASDTIDSFVAGPGGTSGTSGPDTLTGDATANVIDGLEGNDTLYGLGGDDTLIGGDGYDTLDGGEGIDVAVMPDDPGWGYTYGDSVKIYDGDGGYDQLKDIEYVRVGVGGPDMIFFDGTESADDVATDANGGYLFGRDGNDTLMGNSGNDFIRGGDGDDFIAGTDNPLFPDEANDLFGDDGNDQIFGGDNDDWLEGGAGDDLLIGGDGNDWLIGGDGSDVIDGGAGTEDWVDYWESWQGVEVNLAIGRAYDFGTGDTDTLVDIEHVEGSDGHDLMVGNAADNTFYTGNGNDFVDGGLGFDGLELFTGTRADYYITGGGGTYTVHGLNGTGTVETIDVEFFEFGPDTGFLSYTLPTDDADLLADNPAALVGSTGGDSLEGGTGDDVLLGLDGNDLIIGGAGADTLLGGGGNDYFAYAMDMLSDHGGDFIADFDPTQDNIALVGTQTFDLDPGPLVELDTVSSFVVGNLFGIDLWTDSLSAAVSALASWIDGQGGAWSDRPVFLYYTGWTDTGPQGNLWYAADYVHGASNDFVHIATIAVDETMESLSADNIVVTDLPATPQTLTGGVGDDVLVGGLGDDLLTGDDGADELYGLGGDDTLVGGSGEDLLHGGAGTDVAVIDDVWNVWDEYDQVRVEYDGGGGGEDDRLTGIEVLRVNGTDHDLFAGTGGGDRFTAGDTGAFLFGRDGADHLTGGAGWDKIEGGWGNDRLVGQGGEDSLYGDFGDDTLSGGEGADILEGGDGNDVFAYLTSAVASEGDDHIWQFDPSEDGFLFTSDGGLLPSVIQTLQQAGTSTLEGNFHATTLQYYEGFTDAVSHLSSAFAGTGDLDDRPVFLFVNHSDFGGEVTHGDLYYTDAHNTSGYTLVATVQYQDSNETDVTAQNIVIE